MKIIRWILKKGLSNPNWISKKKRKKQEKIKVSTYN